MQSVTSHPWLPCAAPDLLRNEEKDLGREGGDGGTIVLEPKVLVAWGMDNSEAAVADSWILNVSKLTWEKVHTFYVHTYTCVLI